MRKKADLPSKPCATCGRPLVWRRKWAACWDEVGVWGAMEPKTNVSPTNAFRCLLPRRPSRQNSCACRPPG
ncbi:MAG: DUF2256 domain-containing protein [Aquipseudomonas alcaligenes]|uniref:DUF2256 domain-containing protein n=1 Tax=Aquipseudomonas alcaligenes TaxID=43263 RepID=A0A5C7VXM9_AQUAC|nr:MAG: DUF2256 domain-containing protein [Pseudomonas alcaligenes]